MLRAAASRAASLRHLRTVTSVLGRAGRDPPAASAPRTPHPTPRPPHRRPRHAAALSDDESTAPLAKTSARLGSRVGFLGAGAMGEALLRGLLDSGCLAPADVSASVRTESRQVAIKSLGVDAVHGDALTGGAAAVAAASDVIIVAVKPAAFPAVLDALAPSIDVGRHLVVSIAAGITTAAMERRLPPGARVVRVMPNTPSLVGAGASVFALGAAATPDDEAVVARLLASVGLALPVEERLVDAATGLSGCGPAYVLLAIEALADGGVREGLPRDAAIALAAHTVAGAARMVTDLPEGGRVPRHPALLREAVCSPGGATIVGLAELEDAGVRGALARAVGAAARRARELAGE